MDNPKLDNQVNQQSSSSSSSSLAGGAGLRELRAVAEQLTARLLVQIGHAATESIVELTLVTLKSAEAMGLRRASAIVNTWADRNDDPGDVTVQELLDELEAALSALPDVGEHLRAVEQERDELKRDVDIYKRDLAAAIREREELEAEAAVARGVDDPHEPSTRV